VLNEERLGFMEEFLNSLRMGAAGNQKTSRGPSLDKPMVLAFVFYAP
jgi:hypothetical protein